MRGEEIWKRDKKERKIDDVRWKLREDRYENDERKQTEDNILYEMKRVMRRWTENEEALTGDYLRVMFSDKG